MVYYGHEQENLQDSDSSKVIQYHSSSGEGNKCYSPYPGFPLSPSDNIKGHHGKSLLLNACAHKYQQKDGTLPAANNNGSAASDHHHHHNHPRRNLSNDMTFSRNTSYGEGGPGVMTSDF